MKNWLRKRRAKRLARQYECGRSWAIIAWLGGESLESIEAQIYWCDPFSRSDFARAFDRGAGAAWGQLVEIEKVLKTRVNNFFPLVKSSWPNDLSLVNPEIP
jgi:hypothetical protein